MRPFLATDRTEEVPAALVMNERRVLDRVAGVLGPLGRYNERGTHRPPQAARQEVVYRGLPVQPCGGWRPTLQNFDRGVPAVPGCCVGQSGRDAIFGTYQYAQRGDQQGGQ